MESLNYPMPSGRGLTREELDRVYTLAHGRTASLLSATDADTWQRGSEWYPTANLWCRSIAAAYDIDYRRISWALALLSPQNNWRRNKADLVDLIETGTCGAIGLGVARASKVLAGLAQGEEIAGGNKVRSFGFNLTYPHNSYDVTIDSHMAQLLGIGDVKYLERKGVYHALAAAMRDVAIGCGVMPSQLQATLWIGKRGDHK